MEKHPSIEFDFRLAELLGKTVAEIRDMASAEYEGWKIRLGRQAQRSQLAAGAARNRRRG